MLRGLPVLLTRNDGFTLMTDVFRVVDDCLPLEDAWGLPRDEWDVPIWTAAKRSGAHVIVTANLQDGPPPNGREHRVFEGVVWCHPDVLPGVLDRWAVSTVDAAL